MEVTGEEAAAEASSTATNQDEVAAGSSTATNREEAHLASSLRELLSLRHQLHIAQLRQKQALMSTMLEQLDHVAASAAESAQASHEGDIHSFGQRRAALMTRWAAELPQASQLHSDEVDEVIKEAEVAAADLQKSFQAYVDELNVQGCKASRRRSTALEARAKQAGKRRRDACWAVVGRSFADTVRPGLRAAIETLSSGDEGEDEVARDEADPRQCVHEHRVSHKEPTAQADEEDEQSESESRRGRAHQLVLHEQVPHCRVCGRTGFKHWGAATTHEKHCRAAQAAGAAAGS